MQNCLVYDLSYQKHVSDKIDSVFKMEISILVFLATVFGIFGITTCYLVYLTKVQATTAPVQP